MPIKLYSYKFNESTRRWDKDFKDVGMMKLFKCESEIFILGKGKTPHNCLSCGKKIEKGCYFYGNRRSYDRICITCFPTIVERLLSSMKNIENIAKVSLKEYKKKEGMIMKNNLVNSL